jgi:hypothetical protein
MKKYFIAVGETYQSFEVLEKTSNKGRDGSFLWKAKCNKCDYIWETVPSAIIKAKPCLCRFTLPVGESSCRKVYGTYIRRCKRKDIQFSITYEWFKNLTSRVCFYCGAAPSCKMDGPHRNGPYFYNSLDRLDNDKGYHLENVEPCCDICNRAKRNNSMEVFRDWVKRLVNNNKQFIKE